MVGPHFKRMCALLEELVVSGAKVNIIAKFHLNLSDSDILSKYTNHMVCAFINMLDERFKDARDVQRAPLDQSAIVDFLPRYYAKTVKQRSAK